MTAIGSEHVEVVAFTISFYLGTDVRADEDATTTIPAMEQRRDVAN
jgi:hypothetical protein